MGYYFEPVLTEEQMAAYLDGMLSADESNMVEDMIDSSPEMVEIQNVIDSIDISYMYESSEEIPIECMADDFSLPYIDDNHGMDSDDLEGYNYNEEFDAQNDYQNNHDEMDYQDEDSETDNLDNGFDDFSI